ncbi:hypothetical protein ACJZ2D_015644 [Fusarium nematophilum]
MLPEKFMFASLQPAQLIQLLTEQPWLDNVYVRFSFLVAALLVPVAISATQKGGRLLVPIPLASEIRDKQKRAEAYCYQARWVLQKGYERCRDKPFGADTMEAGWSPKKVHHDVTRMVSKISACLMHSESVSNNNVWLDITEGYVLEATTYAQIIKTWPPYLRPLAHWFLPNRHVLSKQWNEAKEVVKGSMERKKAGVTEATGRPPTLLDYEIEGGAGTGGWDLDKQVQNQLLLAVASIHTTSSSIVHCIYDLAARPQYVPELREEIKSVLEECNGTFTKEGLAKLHKLDSFMKESQRFNSPDLTTFQRISIKPFTLPDGTFVPANTKMELATCAINQDERYHKNGTEFDGYRFYRQREEGKKNVSYTSVSRTSLGWGIGRHACPGRFLADIEIKLIVSEILLNYDIKNPDDMPRHPNKEFEAIVFPDPDAEVMFRAL